VNDTVTLLTDLEEFVADHRPHGGLTADATEPASLDRVVMASSHTRSTRAHHAKPDDPGDRAPRDQDDDYDDRQGQHHMADASWRVLDTGHVRPQTVADRVADPDRVGHEKHRPEQVPAQE